MKKRYFKIKWELPGGELITILIDPHVGCLEVNNSGVLLARQPTYMSMLKVNSCIFRNEGLVEYGNDGICFTATSQLVGEIHYADIKTAYHKWIYATRRNANLVSLDQLEEIIFKQQIK